MKQAKQKPEPFRHSSREMAVLSRAHAAMMAHIRAGHRYDVVNLAWVDVNGEVVSQ